MLDPIYRVELSPFEPIFGVYNRIGPNLKHINNMNTLQCKETLLNENKLLVTEILTII